MSGYARVSKDEHLDGSSFSTDEETMAFILALRAEGITDPHLLNLLETLPRRFFLGLGRLARSAGPERSAPIACGQVQTAPSVIARVITALDVRPSHKVLEIGTGSGYQTAILSGLARRVYTLDRFNTLIEEARGRFEALKLSNIVSRVDDGEHGLPQEGTFDRIVLNVAIPSLSSRLLNQLSLGGIIVAPYMGVNARSELVAHHKTADGLENTRIGEGHFLPIIPGVAARL